MERKTTLSISVATGDSNGELCARFWTETGSRLRSLRKRSVVQHLFNRAQSRHLWSNTYCKTVSNRNRFMQRGLSVSEAFCPKSSLQHQKVKH